MASLTQHQNELFQKKQLLTSILVAIAVLVFQFLTPICVLAAEVTTAYPQSGAQGLAIGSTLRFEFDTPIKRGTNSIIIAINRNGSGVVEEFANDSPKIGISGNTLLLRTTASLYKRETTYYVVFKPNSILGTDGSAFDGLINSSTYNFKTFAGNSEERFLYDYVTGGYTIDFYQRDDVAKNGLLSQNATKLFLQGTNTSTTGNKTYVAQASLINSNGILSLNTGFGSTLDKNNSQGLSEEVLDGSSNDQQFLGAALDRSERLILAGKVSSAGADSKGYFVSRFNSNGLIDKTFQSSLGGKRQYDLTVGPDVAWSVIIQKQDDNVYNDQYVIGGTVNDGSSIGLFRLKNDGEPDTSFGVPQNWLQVSTGIELVNQSHYNSSSFVFAKPPSQVSSGDLIVTGSGSENGQRVFRTYSYSSGGRLNSNSFGNSTGQTITNFNPFISDRATAAINYCMDLPESCSQTPGADQNRILVGGTLSGSSASSRWGLVRLDEYGTIDTSWGSNATDFQILNSFDSTKPVTFVDFGVQGDGKLVVLGYVTETTNGIQSVYPKLERYNRDGSLDQSFGKSGNLLIKSDKSVTPYKLSISSDHIFVTATTETASRGTDFAVFVRDKNGKDLFDWSSVSSPVLSSITPVSGTSSVNVNTNIVLTYSSSIKKGVGIIELRRDTASGPIVQTLKVSDSRSVFVSNGSLIINPPSQLPRNTSIFVRVPAGAVLDMENNTLETPKNYYFITGSSVIDNVRPKIGHWTANKTEFTFRFNEVIKLGTKSVLLYQVNSSYVQIGGGIPYSAYVDEKILSIRPTTPFVRGKKYSVEFTSGMITDLAENDLVKKNDGRTYIMEIP